MPGIQCVICLSSDTSTDEWCALRECGHVFHTHCVAQSLEHNRKCPQCRVSGAGQWVGGVEGEEEGSWQQRTLAMREEHADF